MTGKRVQITDDSVVMRTMIRDILEKDGYEIVAEAENGEQALELYKQEKPDLVTMDIVMPREHGLDALKKIIAHDPEARVVLISALHQKALLMEALQSGARDYVIKPFTDEDLLGAIGKALD